MKVNITLSNKEKRHYFFYLLGMMLLTIIFISVITLREFHSPFSDEYKLTDISKLKEKSKFDEANRSMLKVIDSTFTKLDKIDPEKSDHLQNINIDLGISEIGTAFKNTSFSDPRINGYSRIANFYVMYKEDKQVMKNTQENLDLFTKQRDDCLINVKEKKQQMNQ